MYNCSFVNNFINKNIARQNFHALIYPIDRSNVFIFLPGIFHTNLFCTHSRACLKKAFCKMCVTLVGDCPGEGASLRLRQPNSGEIYRKVGRAVPLLFFSNLLCHISKHDPNQCLVQHQCPVPGIDDHAADFFLGQRCLK